LRSYHLNFQSFWVDEIHTMDTVGAERNLQSMIENSKADQPPAYFIILYYWLKVFSYDEFYARLLSVVFGVAGIASVFFLGKEIQNKETGLIASFITSINFFHIAYSQDARFYSLLFLASTLSYLFYLRSYLTRKTSDFILYCICTTILLYTHYYGLVVIASQGIIFIFISIAFRMPLAFVTKAIVAAATCIVLFIPWIPQILKDNSIGSFWIIQVSPDFLIRYFYDYFNKDIVTCIVCASLILMYLKSCISIFQSSTVGSKIIHIIILGWIILGYSIPLAYSIFKLPILINRYTMIVLPVILIVIAIAIQNLKVPRLKLILIGAVTVATLCNFVYFNPYFSITRKQQLREVSEQVSRVKCKDCIYVSDMTWYFNYYFKRFNIAKPTRDVYKLAKEDIDSIDSVWLLAGTHEFLTNPANPDILTKKYYLSYEVNGKWAFGRLYTKLKPTLVTRKNMVIE
jgi:mannosyltransferase